LDDSLEFHQELWRQTTRFRKLPCSVVRVIIYRRFIHAGCVACRAAATQATRRIRRERNL